MSVVLLPADRVGGVAGLPDPLEWAAGVVRVFGEARSGRRPWPQVWPLLDLPVVAEIWPRRRERHPHLLHVGKVVAQSPRPGVWEVTVLVREELRHRAVAIRLDAAVRCSAGFLGPPGPRFTPLTQQRPGRGTAPGTPQRPQVWLATALRLL